ncbi:hypothetical protein CHUAL_009459 [Chamberlinius hualienensis]
MKMEDLDRFRIGARFVCDGHFGTIKYVGPVPPTDGVWLGVVWDDSSRGKHNGTHDGRTYFKTKEPHSGSFIRTKKIDLGINFLEAIQRRYIHNRENNCQNENSREDLCIITKNNAILPVEAVGYEKIGRKQSQLNMLTVVGLSAMNVSDPGAPNGIYYTTPRIRELDLSKNLLCSWDDVIAIAKQLQNLKILNLSCNRLILPQNDIDEIAIGSFENLEELYLNKMDYSWQQILQCAQMWPAVTKLEVAFNRITFLEIPCDSRLQNIQMLSLGHNQITSWFEIVKLGKLPKLESLYLESTGLADIIFEDTPYNGKTSLFQSLEILHLQNNQIGKWESINELNKLQVLKRISIQGNPIWDLDRQDNVWQILVAKLSSLQNLNGSFISSEERRGAELDYIKRYAKDWFSYKNDAAGNGECQTFEYQHPRYLGLVEIYGPPDESEISIQRSVLKNNLLKIEIICPKIENYKPLKKSLPDSMTVEKLVLLAKRLFKTQDVTLTGVSSKNPEHRILLENDQRPLSFYIDDGDQIVVSFE